MTSRLNKYDLTSLSSFGASASPVVQVPELREFVLAEQGMASEFEGTFGPAESDWPVAIHVPETYEDSYAYPLLIWLHADGENEAELEDVMSAISDRNYIGLSFRANCRMGGLGNRHRWSMTLEEARFFEEVLYCTVVRLRRSYHIHSERIAIGGSGSGATLALQTLLTRPRWFSGAVMLGGRLPALLQPLLNYQALRDKRVLQIADTSDPRLDFDEFRGLRRLLYTAGLKVELSVAETNVPCEETLRCVDYWMMDSVVGSAIC